MWDDVDGEIDCKQCIFYRKDDVHTWTSGETIEKNVCLRIVIEGVRASFSKTGEVILDKSKELDADKERKQRIFFKSKHCGPEGKFFLSKENPDESESLC